MGYLLKMYNYTDDFNIRPTARLEVAHSTRWRDDNHVSIDISGVESQELMVEIDRAVGILTRLMETLGDRQ